MSAQHLVFFADYRGADRGGIARGFQPAATVLPAFAGQLTAAA